MTGRAPQGASPYETWVLTLRAWAADPRTSLDELPPLQDDTFTPESYQRLLEHILAAITAASERWHQGLQVAWTHARTPFELGRELVSLRATLARRVQLSSHPSLPPGIRDVLERDVRRAVERYQQELEEAVRVQNSSGRMDQEAVDRMLTVVRDNSFLSVLGYGPGSHGERPGRPPLPTLSPDVPIRQRPRSYRRVVPPATDPRGNPSG